MIYILIEIGWPQRSFPFFHKAFNVYLTALCIQKCRSDCLDVQADLCFVYAPNMFWPDIHHTSQPDFDFVLSQGFVTWVNTDTMTLYYLLLQNKAIKITQ